MDEFEKKKASLLEMGITAAPLAVGVGYSLNQMMQTTKVNVTESTLEQMAKRAQSTSSNMLKSNNRVADLTKLIKPSIDDSIYRTAIIEAIQGLDPVTRRRLNITESDFYNLDGPALQTAIKNKMNTQTIDNDMLFRRFRKNLNALNSQGPMASLNFIKASKGSVGQKFKTLPSYLNEAIQPVASTLGSYKAAFRSTSSAEKAGFGVFDISFPSAPGGALSMQIPLTSSGMLIEGSSMQTRRIAPMVGVLEGGKLNKMTREEFFFREMKESILPDIESGRLSSRREIKRSVNELRNRVFTELESVPNISGENLTSSQKIRNFIRSKQIDIVLPTDRVTENKEGFVSGFRQPTSQELSDTMIQHGLYGGTSPTSIAKARVSTLDITKLSLASEAFDSGRSPEKGFREYQLTPESSTRLLEHQSKRGLNVAPHLLESDEYAEMLKQLKVDQVSPSLRSVYVDPGKHAKLIEELSLSEGHMAMSKKVSRLLEFESVQEAKVSQLREDISKELDTGKPTRIRRGTLLGWDEAHKPVEAESDMLLLNKKELYSESKGNYFGLEYADIRKVKHGDKFFEDVKDTAILHEEENIRRAISKKTNNTLLRNNVDTVISMDVLKKNRAKFRRQMLTSLADQNMMGVDASNFRQLSSQWSSAAGLDDAAFVRQAAKHALSQNASPEQMGSIFGSVPYVLGDEGIAALQESGAGKKEIKQIKKGLSAGYAKISYDSPAAIKGAGAQGSVEPRIFNLLRDEHWGKTGESLSSEIQERLIATSPEKFAIHQELDKTISSLTDNFDFKNVSRTMMAEDYSPTKFKKFIEEGGGRLVVGKGQKDIYVPGSDVISKMRPYTTGAKKETFGDLTKLYSDIAENAGNLHLDTDATTGSEYQNILSKHTDELAYHWAPGGKGMGGYQRGKVLGSQYLRAVTRGETGVQMTDLNTVGVTEAAFEDMTKEIEDLYGPDAAEDLRRRAVKGGQISGLQMRHPFIGSHSVQATNIQVVPGKEKQVILPEKKLDIELADGTRKNITLGPAVGMDADYDADNISLSLLSPDNEKMVRKNILNETNNATQSYAEHQVRYQLLKAGRASGKTGGLSISQKMAADVRKLGVTQQYVPKLSVEMSKAREAVTRFGNKEGAESANFLLHWLEQTPISSKHQSASDVASGGMESLMDRLEYGLQNRDRGALRGVVQDIVKDNEVAREILTSNINLTPESAEAISQATGANIGTSIKGANIDLGIDTIVDSLEAAQSTTRQHSILAGRARNLTSHELATAIRSTASSAGKMANLSRTMSSTVNKLGAIGRGIIKNHKAVGFGFAGSLAIATALSKPIETVGSMKNSPAPNVKLNNSKAGGRMTQENLLPPSPPVGNPSTPQMFSNRRALIESPRQRISVSGNIGASQNMGNIAGSIRNAGVNSNMNINIRDNRQSIDYNTIGNKLI